VALEFSINTHAHVEEARLSGTNLLLRSLMLAFVAPTLAAIGGFTRKS
jgi:hypothetical protein